MALTFTEIERLIGAFLPKAAAAADWWSPAEPSAPQAKAWQAAGYRARLEAREQVVFERAATPRGASAAPALHAAP